jgi:hypothetical protein
MSDSATFHEIAGRALEASSLSDRQAPPEVVDAYLEATKGVHSLLAIAEASEEKLGYWNQQGREGLVPLAGVNNKRGEIRDEARSLSREAHRHFAQSCAKAEEAILASALPKLASDSREALARSELNLALGDAQGSAANARLLGVAKSGSPEVQAVLASPYARTVLIARGVEGVDARLKEAKRIVAHSGSTEASTKAVETLERLKALKAAAIAADSAVNHALQV